MISFEARAASLLLVLGMTVGCYQTRDSFSEDDLIGGSGNDGARFIAAQSIIQNSCGGSSCHSSGSVNGAAFASFNGEAAFLTSGVVGTSGVPCNSVLYRRLRGTNCGQANENMPTGSTLSSTQLNTISEWIRCLDTNQGGC